MGLGFQCSAFLGADRESRIVIACRDVRAGEQAAQTLRRGGGKVDVLPLDLASLASVRAFVEAFGKLASPPLAGLVCNAGVQNIGPPTRSAEGYETTFAVNHLGHYLLARLLLPAMTAGARILFVSSGTHDPKEKSGLPEPRYDNADAVAHDFEPGADAGRRRYTTSKLCNVYCAHELARRLAAAPEPRPATSGERLALLATGPQGAVTGRYFSDGREARSSDLSYDRARAAELWDASARMTQLAQEL